LFKGTVLMHWIHLWLSLAKYGHDGNWLQLENVGPTIKQEIYLSYLDEVETLDVVDSEDDVDTELDVDALWKKFVCCYHNLK